jgi:hypothetical protein
MNKNTEAAEMDNFAGFQLPGWGGKLYTEYREHLILSSLSSPPPPSSAKEKNHCATCHGYKKRFSAYIYNRRIKSNIMQVYEIL